MTEATESLGKKFREKVGDQIPKRALDVLVLALDNGWKFSAEHGGNGLRVAHHGGLAATIRHPDAGLALVCFKKTGAFDTAVAGRRTMNKGQTVEFLSHRDAS